MHEPFLKQMNICVVKYCALCDLCATIKMASLTNLIRSHASTVLVSLLKWKYDECFQHVNYYLHERHQLGPLYHIHCIVG